MEGGVDHRSRDGAADGRPPQRLGIAIPENEGWACVPDAVVGIGVSADRESEGVITDGSIVDGAKVSEDTVGDEDRASADDVVDDFMLGELRDGIDAHVVVDIDGNDHFVVVKFFSAGGYEERLDESGEVFAAQAVFKEHGLDAAIGDVESILGGGSGTEVDASLVAGEALAQGGHAVVVAGRAAEVAGLVDFWGAEPIEGTGEDLIDGHVSQSQGE